MCRPGSWGWGLIPLALIAVAAVVLRAPAISERLEAAALAELRGAGHDWAQIEVAGRDVTLAGVAPDDEALAQAHRILAGLSGPRHVANDTGRPPVRAPYQWWVERSPDTIRIGGHVPSLGLRHALQARARAAFPDAALDDEMTYARGLPEGVDWERATTLLVDTARRLEDGRIELSDDALRVAGRVAGIADYTDLPESLEPLPHGLRTVALDLDPAFVAPHRFEARILEGRIVMAGHAPSGDAAEFARGEAGRMRPSETVEGELSLAAGIVDASDWVAAVRHAFGRFALLDEGGMIAIVDDEIIVEGRAADPDSYVAFLAGLDLAPPGFTVRAAVRPPGGGR
jgi:OmpA-OmpF porin, OOP family